MVRHSMSEVCWRALPGAILLMAAACQGSSAEPVDKEHPPVTAGDAGPDAANPPPDSDPCAKRACGEHAACVADGDVARCVCDDGFMMQGARCEPEPSQTACYGVKCSDHGECSVREGLPVCTCAAGYHAKALECVANDPTDPCSGVTCGPHGDCEVDEEKAALCTCEPGYHSEGLDCVKDAVIDPCANITCSGHGTCDASTGSATCACASGYHDVGLTCVENSVVDPCANVTCSGHGTCNASTGSAKCACASGYHAEGLTCVKDVVVDPCANITCGGHGECRVTDGVAQCACTLGYASQGTTCTPSESCNPINIECVTGRAISSCWLGDDAYYRFADGKKLQGVDAAVGYCQGNTNGTADGDCGGVAKACSSFGAGTCASQKGCTWYASLSLCSGAPSCSGADPSTCAAVQGCFWTDPVPDRVGNCGAQVNSCVQGRPYRFCSEGDDGYYQFQDGKKLQGIDAVIGYCQGETNGTSDGDCGGIAKSCGDFGAATCAGQKGCTWYASLSLCSGVASCNGYEPNACAAVQGCYWTDPVPDRVGSCGAQVNSCVKGRAYRVCTEGDGYYKFEDGKMLSGKSAVTGYCLGLTSGGEDGECGGVGAYCDEFLNSTSCTAQGCYWYSSGFCGGVAPRCGTHYSSTLCEKATGCDWQQPEPFSTERCGSLDYECVTGRRYRVCRDGNDKAYFGFEDGKALYGSGAAFGYCEGEADGVADGNCARTPGATTGGTCSLSYTPSTCAAAQNCTWTPAGP